MSWDLLLLPLLACLLLAGMHAYLGLHVLARGVIFVDLALAQVAALGMTAALLAGHPPESRGAYAWALAFTSGGALLLSLTRTSTRVAITRDPKDRPATTPGGLGGHFRAPRSDNPSQSDNQEALIGIVYAVSAALTVLVLDRVAQGGEQIKQLLVGSLLGVTPEDLWRLAALYGLVGAVHWLARRPLLALSLGADTRGARAWDFLFYLTFGLVVTSSVRIAGVLLVFSYLIVPAVIASWLSATLAKRLAIGWAVGLVASAGGLAVSFAADLPTGAAVVATFGALVALVALARGLHRLAAALRRDPTRVLAGAGVAVGSLAVLAGVALSAFPHADHLWLDALERAVPAVQDAFLRARERQAAADARAAVARGAREVERLRALAADVQWGRRDLPPDQRDRLRQFLAGRDELIAGDRLVLATLKDLARQRQRFVVGLPLALFGVILSLGSLRRFNV